jgi:hypothetical protein
MIQYYNQNYTKDDISKILTEIKICINQGRFSVELNENRPDK